MNALVRESLALWIALVFAAAAVPKFAAWALLPGVVRNFRILPGWLVVPIALALPPTEAAVAAGLLFPASRAPAALVATILFTLFALALAVNLRRGRTHIDCGCFRTDLAQPISAALVLRNVVLTVATLPLLFAAHPAAAPRSLLEWLVAGGAAATLLLCYLSVGGLFQPRRSIRVSGEAVIE